MASETTPAAPFLKWAGGKGQLLEQYRALFPTRVETYYEPFVGSAAVFFHLQARGFARRYVLSDVNADLINVYRVVRDDLDGLLALLEEHQASHSAEHFYAVRALDRDPAWKDAPAVVRAARMIYLNNDLLQRPVAREQPGVLQRADGPLQEPDHPGRAASAGGVGGAAMRRSPRLRFQDGGATGPGGRFCLLRPAVSPVSATANFTSYAKDAFGVEDQQALAGVFRDLHIRGCRVMLSNSDTPLIRALYRDFRIETVYARRLINSRAEKRGPISEVVVLNNV